MQDKKAYLQHVVTTLFAVMLTTTAATAQFAFEGGLNMAKLGITLGGHDFSTSFKRGAAIGILADLEMQNGFFLQPGLFLRTDGTTVTNPKGDYSITATDLQLNLEY